jgi:adenine-specific DNA-methyltransferase
MTKTRQKLLENFDDEVREKLREQADKSERALNKFERLLMRTTQHELNGHAEFLGDSSFRLRSPPFPEKDSEIPLGLYELPRRTGEAHLYRLNHPLAEAVLERASQRELAAGAVLFDYKGHKGKVTTLEQFVGKAGWLLSSIFTVEAMGQAEDYLLLAAITDDGTVLDYDTAHRLLTLPGSLENSELPLAPDQLEVITHKSKATVQHDISERNAQFFELEVAKLENWAEDLKLGLEREIKEVDRQIKEARRAATTALTLEAKLAGQKQIRTLEAQRSQKRRSLFDAQDDVDKQRESLISAVEGKLEQKSGLRELFTVRWTLS